MKYTILLPTLNEELGLIKTVVEIDQAIRPDIGKHEFHIVVVDGGSTDKTLEWAYHLGCETVSCKVKGKGAAIAQAIKELPTPDYFIMLDADYTYNFKRLWRDIEGLTIGTKYLVGLRTYRVEEEKGAMPLPNKVANWVMTNFARILYWDFTLKDLCSGFWVIQGDTAKWIDIESKGFTLEAELYFVTRRQKPCNLVVGYRKRVGGEKKTKPIDAIKICWYLLRKRWTRNP